jgi:Big-like domain-containing protein
MNFSPTFGIAALTRFDYNASASDADGDPLTFTWDVAGNASTGSSGSITFSPPGGSGTATLTVSDGKGGTATDTRQFVAGSGSGTWRGTWGGWVFTSNLTQSNTALTGDYSDQLGPGRLDTAVANTIDTNGNVRLRYKQAIFSDFIFTGTMDNTGRRITGVVNGSGASNVPFTMTK